MQEIKELIIDDNIFFVNGIKAFIEEYEKNYEKIYLNKNMYINKIYEDKRNTIRSIRDKRNEYKEKIILIENKINLLNSTLKELEIERNLRIDKVKESSELDNDFRENIEDIIDAISENKKIISLEEDKIKDIKIKYISFNDSSLEDEKIVYIFFNYIKREFFRFQRDIVKLLNSDTLSEYQLILMYEYLLIITRRIVFIEEDLLGG